MGLFTCQACHLSSWSPLCPGCVELLRVSSSVCLRCGEAHRNACQYPSEPGIEYSSLYSVSVKGASLLNLWVKKRGWLFDRMVWKINPTLEERWKQFDPKAVLFGQRKLKDQARWIGKLLEIPVYSIARYETHCGSGFQSVLYVDSVRKLPTQNSHYFERWKSQGVQRIHCFSIGVLQSHKG